MKLNPAVGQLQGRVGNLVFRKYGNTTVVYEYEKPKRSNPTGRQKVKRDEFKKAIEYARMAMRDPALKLQYQQKAREVGRGNAYNAAISDFMQLVALRKG